MSREKHPRLEPSAPAYPMLPGSGIDRRRFFALLGQGAAAAALATACGDRRDRFPERLDGEPPVAFLDPPEVRTPARALAKVALPGPVDVIDDHSTPAAPPTSRVTMLRDGTEVAFLLYFSARNPAGRDHIGARASALLAAADEAVSRFSDARSIQAKGASAALRDDLRSALGPMLGDGRDARFLDVEITRVIPRGVVRGRPRVPDPEPVEDVVIPRTAGVPPRPSPQDIPAPITK